MNENLADRVMRLEESQAFLERTTEQLHDETLTLARRVEALTSRLAKVEAALAERPAHSPADSGGSNESGQTEGPGGAGGAGGAGGPGGAGEGAPEFETPPHAHRPVDRHAGRTTDPFGPRGDPPPGVG